MKNIVCPLCGSSQSVIENNLVTKISTNFMAGLGATLGFVGAKLPPWRLPPHGPVFKMGPIMPITPGLALGAKAGQVIGKSLQPFFPEEYICKSCNCRFNK